MYFFFLFYAYGDHRDLHVLTHSFPTRRSSVLREFQRRRDAVATGGGLKGRHQRGDVANDEDFAGMGVENIGRLRPAVRTGDNHDLGRLAHGQFLRSEEHTSELQSLMRISYAVFCLKKKKQNSKNTIHTD